MESFKKINGKVSLILIAGILIMCACFALTGCGNSVLKVLNPQVGQCALDFSLDTTNFAALVAANNNFPSIAGNSLTVEAWVKPGAPTSTAATGIFARFGSAGAILYVEGGIPKFALRQFTPSPPAASTSTDYTVSATTAIAQDTWYHLAGVVVNEDHGDGVGADDHGAASANPILCADGNGNPTGGESETPHIDIYVDGKLEACATTWDTTSFGGPQGVSDPSVFGTSKDTNVARIGLSATSVDGATGGQFQGAIDEVRLWTVARSKADILACANVELSSTGSGACSVDSTKLKGYWKMNECKGTNVADWSGAGSAGGLEVNGIDPWSDGWVTGAPVILLQ